VLNEKEIELTYINLIIEFKNKQDLNQEFLDEEGREILLKKIIETLDLEENLWDDYQCEAYKKYHIYHQLKRDDDMEKANPIKHKKISQNYLKQAVEFNPFNAKILKEYISFNNLEVDDLLKKRYLSFFHPNSAQYQEALVWLSLKDEPVIYNYLADDILKPITDWLVQHKKNKVKQSLSTKKLDKTIKEETDIDKKTFIEIKQNVEELLKLSKKVHLPFSLSWDDVILAKTSIDKALKIAIYNEEVLIAGIEFYGNFYWRLLFNSTIVSQDKQKEQNFKKSIFGSVKVKQDVIIKEAKKGFNKAIELNLILKKIKQDMTADKDYYANKYTFSLNRIKVFNGISKEEELPCYTDGLLEKEAFSYDVLEKEFLSIKKKNIRDVFLIILALILLGLYFLAIKLF